MEKLLSQINFHLSGYIKVFSCLDKCTEAGVALLFQDAYIIQGCYQLKLVLNKLLSA